MSSEQRVTVTLHCVCFCSRQNQDANTRQLCEKEMASYSSYHLFAFNFPSQIRALKLVISQQLHPHTEFAQ